jgi:1-phosphofructokinase family hexose kinase
MILCVTPNVALDRTLVVPGYGAGGVFRPQQVIAAAGGKGVNVARVVNLFGGVSRCHGFIAGHTGALVASLAAGEGLDSRWTVLDSSETRTCTILVDPAREQTTVVNESGVETNAADWGRLRDDLIASADSAAAVCFCGSLPPGSPLDAFAALLAELVALGTSIWVDTSGPPLRVAAEVKGVHIKVNDDEAAALLNAPVKSLAEASVGAKALAKRTSASVVITMGAHGAVLSDGQTAWHALPPAIEAKSAVGSGDSFLAGLLVGLEAGEPPDQSLRRGVAAGAANALSIGGGQFKLEDYERILSKVVNSETIPG